MKKVINILPNRKEYCLLVKTAFDNEFCDQLISEKKKSFKEAKTHYPTSYRNNERQVLDNENLSKQLFQEIKSYIPNEIKIEGINKEEYGNWKLDSLNSRIRICRYLPNQYFNKHLDGVHFVSALKQSKLTFMIYLNGSEEFEGGKTLFFNSKENNEVIGRYEPKKGDLIIFDHNLWHSGETVLSGEKYILRSDIIYQKIEETQENESKFCGEGHLGYIWTATIFNDRLITSGRDKKIKIWSKEGKKVSEIIGHKNSILNLIVFDKETIISASRDMSIKIWSKLEGDKFQLKNSINYHVGIPLCLCKVSEDEFFSGGADGNVNQIDLKGRLIDKFNAHDEWIWGIAKIDDDYYTTISEDGSIKIWEFKQNRELVTREGDLPINSIAIRNHVIYLGRFDGTIIKLRFEKKKKKLREIAMKKCHNGIIRKILIDDNFLYSASEDNTLKVWDGDNLEFIEKFEHKNFVQDIAIFDDSIITVSYDGKIKKNKKPVDNSKSSNSTDCQV